MAEPGCQLRQVARRAAALSSIFSRENEKTPGVLPGVEGGATFYFRNFAAVNFSGFCSLEPSLIVTANFFSSHPADSCQIMNS